MTVGRCQETSLVFVQCELHAGHPGDHTTKMDLPPDVAELYHDGLVILDRAREDADRARRRADRTFTWTLVACVLYLIVIGLLAMGVLR